MKDMLTDGETRTIERHVRAHSMTLALVRTERAPPELTHLLDALGRRLGTKLTRTYSSPMSEFFIAELASRDRSVVLLFMPGKRTELLSVSETDHSAVRDLEDSIHYSNFHSEIMRHGL